MESDKRNSNVFNGKTVNCRCEEGECRVPPIDGKHCPAGQQVNGQGTCSMPPSSTTSPRSPPSPTSPKSPPSSPKAATTTAGKTDGTVTINVPPTSKEVSISQHCVVVAAAAAAVAFVDVVKEDGKIQ